MVSFHICFCPHWPTWLCFLINPLVNCAPIDVSKQLGMVKQEFVGYGWGWPAELVSSIINMHPKERVIIVHSCMLCLFCPSLFASPLILPCWSLPQEFCNQMFILSIILPITEHLQNGQYQTCLEIWKSEVHVIDTFLLFQLLVLTTLMLSLTCCFPFPFSCKPLLLCLTLHLQFSLAFGLYMLSCPSLLFLWLCLIRSPIKVSKCGLTCCIASIRSKQWWLGPGCQSDHNSALMNSRFNTLSLNWVILGAWAFWFWVINKYDVVICVSSWIGGVILSLWSLFEERLESLWVAQDGRRPLICSEHLFKWVYL